LATNVAKVGIELSNGGAHLDLFASERWLEQKLSELDLGTLSANRDADRAP